MPTVEEWQAQRRAEAEEREAETQRLLQRFAGSREARSAVDVAMKGWLGGRGLGTLGECAHCGKDGEVVPFLTGINIDARVSLQKHVWLHHGCHAPFFKGAPVSG